MGTNNGMAGMKILFSVLVIISGLVLPEIAGQAISPGGSPGPEGRPLIDSENVTAPMTQSDDTIRIDPLDNFKKYRGGFDITNKHYWSSTIFTGVYGYAIGLLWLFCGIVYGTFLLTTRFCLKRKKEKMNTRFPCHKNCALWHILLAIVLTILAVFAMGLVFGGNVKFRSQAGTVVNIILKIAKEASETISSTTRAMVELESNLVGSTANVEASEFLSSTSFKLDSTAEEIETQAKKNRRLIDKVLKILYAITTISITLNLVAAIALSVCGVLRIKRALHLLITLCWIMTVICWMFFGVYFFIEKLSTDTCTAIESFQQNPYNNSLSSILPCEELLSAKSVLSDFSAGIYNIVNEVNSNISAMQITSYPDIVLICNPFSEPPEYVYQPEKCPANTIRIGDIPKALEFLTCSDATVSDCGREYMSDSDYRKLKAYTSSIQNLLNVYPGMERLVECESVKDAFSEILLKHCNPLKKFVRLVWAAMVLLSVIMVLLVLLWTIKAHHEQLYHFSDGSVKPHSIIANELETGEAKDISNN